LITDEELARHLRATPATAGPYPVVTVEPGPVEGLLSQLLLYFEWHPEHAEVRVRRGDVLLGYLHRDTLYTILPTLTRGIGDTDGSAPIDFGPDEEPAFEFPLESGHPPVPRRESHPPAPPLPPPVSPLPAPPSPVPISVEPTPPDLGSTQPRTRTAYARLDAPGTVPVGELFTVTVGLAAEPSRQVNQPSPFRVPDEDFTLTVQLSVHGFTIAGGVSRYQLPVTAAERYPFVLVGLTAVDDPELDQIRTILVSYSVDGGPLGVATRAVRVVPAGSPRVPDEAAPAAGGEWGMPDPADRPDLTIVLRDGDDTAHEALLWTLSSPHAAVPIPAEPVRTRTDRGVPEWAGRMTAGVEERKGSESLRSYLRGIAAEVGDLIPDAVLAALGAAAAVNPLPTVLLLTNEPYIPWELARVPRPWNTGRPAYLGAQTIIGRWLYSANRREPAPVARLTVRDMAVVSGEYPNAPLPQAAAEAAELRQRFHARALPARLTPIMNCLEGDPEVQVLHLAVHGSFDPSGYRDGIILEDDTTLEPTNIRGVERSPVRLVFLNACQLARGGRALGDYASMATALLRAGAQGVIAPLWKVDDGVAKDVATKFYTALGAGTRPAEFLAGERAAASIDGEGTPSGTRLAYLFFGHPGLTVAGLREREE
jgi:CHAT domain